MSEVYERAQLGVDGNACFALVGNIWDGEAVFVTLPPGQEQSIDAQISCCKEAFRNLYNRLNRPGMSYYFGESHPFGGVR